MRTGNSDEITREYLDSLLLKMRHIDGRLPDTKMTLFGESFATPVMTAALSHLHNTRENGMAEMAAGAKAAGAVYWCGMGDEAELEAITATGAKVVKIIKPHEDNRVIFRRIEHAKRCGVFALGMDIDHAMNQKGGYDVVMGLPMRSKSKEELQEFVQAAGIPFIIKGVLDERDAEKCAQIGAAGIVLSHHHNIMEFAAPPVRMLPEIRKTVGTQMKLFADCGMVSGMDVFKALAMGADAVCAGRALMEPLREKGARGVEAAIREMTAQLAGVMGRTGYASIEEIDASCIVCR